MGKGLSLYGFIHSYTHSFWIWFYQICGLLLFLPCLPSEVHHCVSTFSLLLPSGYFFGLDLDRYSFCEVNSRVRFFLDLSGRTLSGVPYPLSVSALRLLLISSGSSRYATDFHRVFDTSCSCVLSWWFVSCMYISRKHACSSDTTHVSLTWSCLEKLRWIEEVCWAPASPPCLFSSSRKCYGFSSP